MLYKALFRFRIKELNYVRIIFAFWILGFVYGTRNHILDILADGWLGYDFAPLPVNLYWTLLTFLDPLAILLLLSSPFAGILLSVLIMASDLAVNTGVTLYFLHQESILSFGLLPLQIAFGVFVFLTAPLVWKTLKKIESASSP